MACDNWIPFYVRRYLGDTGNLTTEQHGAYFLLLTHYWLNGPLSNDDEDLAIIARVHSQEIWEQRYSRKIRAFFTVGEDGLLHQKRADCELGKQRGFQAKREEADAKKAEISEKRSRTGRLGAQKRWNQDDHALAATATVTQPAGDADMANGMAKPDFAMANAMANRCLLQVQEERVPEASLQGADAPQKLANDKVQGSLLPEPETKPTAKALVFSEGLDILRALRPGAADGPLRSLLGKMRKEAHDDDERLITVLRQCRLAEPADPVPWIKTALAKPTTPKLVVDNDPADRFGVNGWCRASGFEPTVHPMDQKNGKWLAAGRIVDRVAREVAEAANLPSSWRGDWSPLIEWLNAGLNPDQQIIPAIRRMTQLPDYAPPQSIRFFNNAVMARRAA